MLRLLFREPGLSSWSVDLSVCLTRSMNFALTMTTCATSSLDTVTKVCACGSVLSNQPVGSGKSRRVKACLWRVSLGKQEIAHFRLVERDAFGRVFLKQAMQKVQAFLPFLTAGR
jgi:hypothetical protein